MKKSILISIRPKWVEKILTDEKTIEIRKTAPKCELPIDVYIYCTKGNRYLSMDTHHCCIGFDLRGDTLLNGKVVAKFTLRKINEIENEMKTDLDDSRYPSYFTAEMSEHKLLENAFLTAWEIHEYLKRGKGYAWHISDLEIFDKPKELSDFFSLPETYHHDHESMVDYYERKEARRLKRAPQSWQYVEVER